MFLIFDTETTGLPKRYDAPLTDFDNWPRLVQLAWQVHDEHGNLLDVKNFIVRPDGFVIPRGAAKVHGITTEFAEKEGISLDIVLEEFNKVLNDVTVIVGHNIEFDLNILGAEYLRREMNTTLLDLHAVDTKDEATAYCALPGGKGGNFKWPTLDEMHKKLFGESFDAAHNASADVQATARCFLELIRIGVIDAETLKLDPSIVKAFIETNKEPFQSVGIDVEPYHLEAESEQEESTRESTDEVPDEMHDISFTHLHVHTQYSILDGLSPISSLVEKAKSDGMKALAITDHGSMFGVKEFHDKVTAAGLKPIIGCEVYVARRGMKKKQSKVDGGGWHLVLLAKNITGYRNLIRIVSEGWIEGYYYKPRIEKSLLKKYKEGLIALTACLGGEVPDKIIHEGEAAAEEALLEYKEIFGEDLYLELQKHPTGDPEMDKKVFDDQVYVNNALAAFAKKHNLRTVATNDVHFVDKDDASAHDRLICIGTASDLDDPRRMRYTRQEWFKTQKEMKALFSDFPDSLNTTQEIVDKVEIYELNSAPIMPEFEIPSDFSGANEYLRHIAFEGAKVRYGEVSEEITERLDFELETIQNMGFPDYFLIVWDFLKAARDMGVWVGPGRGSAAGSVVSYCLRITDIDPLKYDLLFERFLNPDRISMPDIDIDFDDEGRNRLLEWVSEKYGKMRVAHLITFGTMAAKMAIRDVSRVQKLPLPEADRLAKMVPETPGMSLDLAFKEVGELKKELKEGSEEVVSVLENARRLEGSVRNTGTHACGIIIGREDLHHYVPLATVKGSVLDIATQYDGKYIESIGLLKMDFLGLKTLSIIKDTLQNIKLSKGIELDIEAIPFDDKETYELYSRGDTVALFQFESDGMQKYLKDLKPTRFEDLIAMNALYRPGPMKYIPNFIKRKHGKQKIEYELPMMEEILEETYGITVYQEQVMLLARRMAGFSRGESDSLRKAMGKKKLDEMAKLMLKFFEGSKKNGIPQNKAIKIWKDWEEFAKYAFNKSHATCYSYLSYQTAYLKTHYPAEFMAANLSHNLNDIKKITQLIGESNRMGIDVMRPDVNESSHNFTVTKEGVIRFGLAAIKGVGRAAVEQIIEEREKNGLYNSVFDFAKRVNLKSVNKRSFEAMAMAGAFDGFPNSDRSQYFFSEKENGPIFIETIIRHGAQVQQKQNSPQASLFGESDVSLEVLDPVLPQAPPWTMMHKLKLEKEVTGFYISGHPLDEFKLTMERFCNVELNDLKNNMEEYLKKKVTFAGMITESRQKISKKGSPFGIFALEDYSGSMTLMLFNEDYLKRKHMLEEGNKVFVTATVEERYNQPGNFEVRISEIFLLAETMSKLAKSVTVNVDLEEIDEGLISLLDSTARENNGNCTLQFRVRDEENDDILTMRTTDRKVDPRSFIHDLMKKSRLTCSIN